VCVHQPVEVIEQLETNEFYELEPPVKLQILVGLCHRIMASYSVQDYMDERSNDACKLWLVSSRVTLPFVHCFMICYSLSIFTCYIYASYYYFDQVLVQIIIN